ncbi:MAG: SixA phosphatase family protein [Bacteroidota bacterium]
MKKKALHIVRHGKSSWKYENIMDYDRPLKNRGIKNNYSIAEKISSFVQVDLIISSPAVRALHTATIFARVLDLPLSDLALSDVLYASHEEVVYNFLTNLDNEHNQVMVVGHNPTLTNLANRFIAEPIDNIPTSGCVSIKFDVDDWGAIEETQVKTVHFTVPEK